MDIYQIWTIYNKQWSMKEILIFSAIIILSFIIVLHFTKKGKINRVQAIAIVAQIIFLSIVFRTTIFTREPSIRQYELIPFWSWRDTIVNHDMILLEQNLLNCILLLPAGALLPLIVYRKVKWYKALFFGVMVSAFIEFSQLIFKVGLFEWDDMIHNGLGCMIGCVIMNRIMSFVLEKRNKE